MTFLSQSRDRSTQLMLRPCSPLLPLDECDNNQTLRLLVDGINRSGVETHADKRLSLRPRLKPSPQLCGLEVNLKENLNVNQ
jgi:hypothetical protein